MRAWVLANPLNLSPKKKSQRGRRRSSLKKPAMLETELSAAPSSFVELAAAWNDALSGDSMSEIIGEPVHTDPAHSLDPLIHAQHAPPSLAPASSSSSLSLAHPSPSLTVPIFSALAAPTPTPAFDRNGRLIVRVQVDTLAQLQSVPAIALYHNLSRIPLIYTPEHDPVNQMRVALIEMGIPKMVLKMNDFEVQLSKLLAKIKKMEKGTGSTSGNQTSLKSKPSNRMGTSDSIDSCKDKGQYQNKRLLSLKRAVDSEIGDSVELKAELIGMMCRDAKVAAAVAESEIFRQAASCRLRQEAAENRSSFENTYLEAYVAVRYLQSGRRCNNARLLRTSSFKYLLDANRAARLSKRTKKDGSYQNMMIKITDWKRDCHYMLSVDANVYHEMSPFEFGHNNTYSECSMIRPLESHLQGMLHPNTSIFLCAECMPNTAIFYELTTHPSYYGSLREGCQHAKDIEQWVLRESGFDEPELVAWPPLAERTELEKRKWAASSKKPTGSKLVVLPDGSLVLQHVIEQDI